MVAIPTAHPWVTVLVTDYFITDLSPMSFRLFMASPLTPLSDRSKASLREQIVTQKLKIQQTKLHTVKTSYKWKENGIKTSKCYKATTSTITLRSVSGKNISKQLLK